MNTLPVHERRWTASSNGEVYTHADDHNRTLAERLLSETEGPGSEGDRPRH